jgi:hypothetical protein
VVCFPVASAEVQLQILGRLRKGHPALDAEIAAGNLVLSEYAATVSEQNEFWERSFVAALGRGASALRVVGDSPWPGSGSPLADAIAYEREYERLFARRFPLVTLCLYPADSLTGRDVCEIYSSHPDSFAYPVERIID